jgi:hypothetical protein
VGKIIVRDNWNVIFGRDVYNEHAGFTWRWGKLNPAAFHTDWLQWRLHLRVNVRWPITFSLKRCRRLT